MKTTNKTQDNALIKKKQSEIMLKDKTNKKPIVKSNKGNSIKEIVKPSNPVTNDCPEEMVLGTPSKCVSESVLPGNVFENSRKPGVEDIDAKDNGNPQLCVEFVNDIYHYMLHLESVYSIQPQYLKNSNLKSKMRSILVDWLIQVHHRFQLLQETLYLTIALLDRFLQVTILTVAYLYVPIVFKTTYKY